jgi:hypothetical protein
MPAHPRILATLALLGLLAASPARAQDEPRSHTAARLYVDGQLGILGDARITNDGNEASDSLEPSGGAVIGFEAPVVPFFSVGAEVGFWIWNTDGGDDWEIDPSGLVDVSFVPRLRLPFGNGDDGGGHGAAYVAGLFGPTFSFPSEDVQDGLASLGADIGTGFGLQGGGLVGIQLFPIRSFGFDLAVGYQHHIAWHEVDGIAGDDTVQLDLGQLILRAGVAIAF